MTRAWWLYRKLLRRGVMFRTAIKISCLFTNVGPSCLKLPSVWVIIWWCGHCLLRVNSSPLWACITISWGISHQGWSCHRSWSPHGCKIFRGSIESGCFIWSGTEKNLKMSCFIPRLHSVEIVGFFYHSYFMWNQF